MVFNADKFECLRIWPGKSAKPDTEYLSPGDTPIEEKSHLRDLGVELSNDLSFTLHIENTVASANKLIGWSLRTFRRRSSLIMMTIWKSLVQSKLDYCSQLWSPTDQASILRLESVFRHFSSQVAGLDGLDYWERLIALKQYSQERRRERYRILFIWKVLQGLVSGYSMQSYLSPRRGRLVVVAKYNTQAPAAVRRAKESSLPVHGAKLFNLMPRHLRDISTGTVEQFKSQLDTWLQSVPDQPSIPSRQRAAQTNSLTDQAAYAVV